MTGEPLRMDGLTGDQIRAEIQKWKDNVLACTIALNDARAEGDRDAILFAEAERDRTERHLAQLIEMLDGGEA